MKIICAYCKKQSEKRTGNVNRALSKNLPLYCDRICAGLGRRNNKTPEQLKEEKRIYDIEYRNKNLLKIKERKKDYFKKTYNPEKAAIERKKRMPKHLEYCRQPEYKAKKKVYDRQYRAKAMYGEFWESFLLVEDIDKEVSARMTDVEIRQIKGTLNNKLQRRRDYERERKASINSQ